MWEIFCFKNDAENAADKIALFEKFKYLKTEKSWALKTCPILIKNIYIFSQFFFPKTVKLREYFNFSLKPGIINQKI